MPREQVQGDKGDGEARWRVRELKESRRACISRAGPGRRAEAERPSRGSSKSLHCSELPTATLSDILQGPNNSYSHPSRAPASKRRGYSNKVPSNSGERTASEAGTDQRAARELCIRQIMPPESHAYALDLESAGCVGDENLKRVDLAGGRRQSERSRVGGGRGFEPVVGAAQRPGDAPVRERVSCKSEPATRNAHQQVLAVELVGVNLFRVTDRGVPEATVSLQVSARRRATRSGRTQFESFMPGPGKSTP